MRFTPHPAVLQQFSAPQPRWTLVLLCFFVPDSLLTFITYLLMKWPLFVSIAAPHPAVYKLTFLVLQVTLCCGACVLLSRRYPSALWLPSASWWRGFITFGVLLLPAFLFYLVPNLRMIWTILPLIKYPDGASDLETAYLNVWQALPYGTSPAGVLGSSIIAYVAPMLEEILFTGIAVNAAGKRLGTVAATLGVPLAFALFHAKAYGFGIHLLALYFASVTYILIRLFSGSLAWSVLAHWIINTIVYLPNWLLAIIHIARS